MDGVFKSFDAYAYLATVAGSFGRKNPGQVRDIVYSFIARLSIGFHSQILRADSVSSTHLQRRVAKYTATLAYFWAVIATVLLVLLFLVDVIFMELILTYFPQSESIIHVGAWRPWANTGLVVFAAFVGQFHKRLIRSIRVLARRALSIVGHRAGGARQMQYHIQKGYQADQQLLSERLEPPSTESQNRWGLLRTLHIFSFASNRLFCVRQDLKEERVLLKALWENPGDAFNNSPMP